MTKAYIVFHTHHEHSEDICDLYNSEYIEKVFDSEVKAVNYIFKKIKNDHEMLDVTHPGDETIIKHKPSLFRIHRYLVTYSWERMDGNVYILDSYRYETHDVG